MKYVHLLVLAVGAAALSACDEPRQQERPGDETVTAVETAPAVEDAPPEAVAGETTPPDQPPPPLPTDTDSERTVQPESETLFY